MSSTKLSAYCSKVVEAGWIAAAVMVPLYFNVYSSRVFEPDKLTLLRSIAVFMSVAWLIKVIEELSHKRPVFRFSWRTPLVLPALVLVVIYLLTTLTSVTPFTSLWGSYQRLQGTYTTLSYIVVFFLILSEMRSREQLDRLITAAIVTSVPISLYGLIQHYGIDPLPWGGDVTTRVASNMGNAIFISAYEIMIFFLTLGRIVESFIAILTEEDAQVADILRAAAYIFTALIQIITIWFSQSRGPWMGLMVGAFTFVLFGLLALRRVAPDKTVMDWTDVLKALGGTALVMTVVGFVALLATRRTWKWLWLSWVLLAVLVAGFLVVFNLPNTPLEPLRTAPYIGRLGRVFQTESGTGKVRVLIWEGAVDMISPHEPLSYPVEDPSQPHKTDKLSFLRPLIGYGPESMYVAYNPFYPSDLAHYERRNASPDRSHNETFDALVITGVIGLVGYMALFGSVFYYGLKWMGWINDTRQRNVWLGLFVGGGVVGAVALMLLQGVEFLGVGLPFGMAGGLVLYLIFYASFLYRAPEQDMAVSTEVEAKVAQRLVGAREILLVSLVSAIVAHFVEIHFGIAIAATRTYFWVYAALLVLLGTGMLDQPVAEEQTADKAAAQEESAETPRAERRKRRRRRRPSPQQRPQAARPGLPAWLGPVLVSALVLTLIMGTLGLDFVTNAGRINAEDGCDPQAGRMLQPCWISKAWDIVKHDLTVLPKQGSRRPQETNTFMTLGLLFLTLLIGSVVVPSEMARRGLFKRSAQDWGWGTLLLVSLAILLTLIVLLSIADRHLQLGRVQRDVDQTSLVGLISGLLNVSMYLSSILVVLYFFVFLFVLGAGLVLLIGNRLPKTWATPWGLMAALPLFILALFIINQTNLKVIRADIVYKQGEEWSRQRQWDIAIAHHKRALELAPNEDFYYLWAGSAYLEKSKSAPAQGCIITGKPDISGVLSMSVEQTAQLCRQDLLTAARTILLQARHVNPLNTDHTANLARLYKNWADLATTPEEREDYIDRSIGYYEQATVLSPQNTIVWNELATVYLYQKKDLEQAFETIAYSLELDDRYFQTYLIQGDALLTEAQAVAREMALKQEELISASEDQKATFETDVSRLRAEWERKLDAAIASYQQALELDPSLMNVYVTIAGAYEQMGRFEDAVATFDDAAAANPKSAQPYLGLAELYQRSNNPEAAVAAYRQAIALAPDNADYRIALANLLESLGQPNEALLEVQEAARLKPEDPTLRQSLALMYHRFQMYSEALAEARAAAQLAPDDATTQLLIGDSSRMLNDLEAAAAAYEQALVIAPDLANAWNVHLNLALIYQESGQLDLALTHATAALQAAPEDQRPQINDFVVQLESQGAGSP